MAASKKDDPLDDPFEEATRFDPNESVRLAQETEGLDRAAKPGMVPARTTIDLVPPNVPRDPDPTTRNVYTPPARQQPPQQQRPPQQHQQPPQQPEHYRPPPQRKLERPATADSLNQEWAPLYLDDEVLGSRSVNLKMSEADLAALHTPAPPADLAAAVAPSSPSKPAPIRVKRNSVPASMPPRANRPSQPAPMPPRANRPSQPAPMPPRANTPSQPVPQRPDAQAVPRHSVQEDSAPNRFPPPPAAQVMPGKAADPKLHEGSRIGNYEVIRKIGQGGMGVVYEGRHLLLPRRVAIKFLLTNQSHDEEQIRRFLGEAVASAQIGHKGVVDIYDYGYDENKTAYLIMEFVDGQSLQTIMKRSGQLPIPMVVRVVRDIAQVLAAAHQSGIVHRDLKPDNIILSRDEFGKDFVKILDFGVAKFVNDQGMSGQTVAGSILGTPWYMPPEQCQGLREVDFRSDIYALGCVFYQMLCGKVPFAGSLRDVLTAHIHTPATPPSQFNPSLPQPIEALIQRMMAKDPASRPHSMEEVAQVLSGFAEPVAPHGSVAGAPPVHEQRSSGPVATAPAGRSWLLPMLAALIACGGTAAAFYFLQ